MREHTHSSRVLAVDWGGKRLGIAISDPTNTLARPLIMINHISCHKNAVRILDIAKKNDVKKIIIGVTYEDDNSPTHSGRSALRLLKELERCGEIPIFPWNEEGTTRTAVNSHVDMRTTRKKRKGRLDSIAAAYILQDYLNVQKQYDQS